MNVLGENNVFYNKFARFFLCRETNKYVERLSTRTCVDDVQCLEDAAGEDGDNVWQREAFLRLVIQRLSSGSRVCFPRSPLDDREVAARVHDRV